ncbi:MAG TPA: T9SS type A sorting domain-containing protein [Bacteroidia bacterium]|nr:T9SS type A sorting domain-containing protein [Bacteroidia bacterium]
MELGAQTWIRKNDFPGNGRLLPVSFTIGDTGYFGYGTQVVAWPAKPDSINLWKYNSSADVWIPVASLPNGEADIAFGIGNYGYAKTLDTTGINNNLFYQYNPSVNSWTPKATFPFNNTMGEGAFVMNGFGFIMGGSDTSSVNAKKNLYQYNPSLDQWTEKDSMPAGLSYPDCIATNGVGYVAAGLGQNGSFSNSVFQYNPSVDAWSALPSFPGKSHGSRNASFILNNQIYICNDSAQFWSYNPVTNTWLQLPDTPFDAACASYVLHGVAYIVTEQFKQVWQYCPPVSIQITGDTVICAGSLVPLHVSGAVSYSWTPSTGLTDTGTDHPIASPVNSIVYTVIATDSIGCKHADSVKINVNQLPAISLQATKSVICPGDTTTLSANGGLHYFWSPSTGLNNPSIASPLAEPPHTTEYTVKVIDSYGCVNYDSILISLHSIPVLRSAASAFFICPGDTSVVKVNGASSYIWSPSSSLSDSTGSFVKAFPLASVTYTVTALDTNGCSEKTLIPITVHPLPTIQITSTPAVLCKGDTAVLTASGNLSFLWSPATSLNNTSGLSVKAFPDSSMIYTITGLDTNGTCKTVSFLSLPVNPSPVIPLISSNFDVLTSSSFSGNQWYLNGNTLSASINQTDTVNQNGTYVVCVTNTKGCIACSAPFVFGAMGISENSLGATVSVYPNPANDYVMIEYTLPEEEKLNLELFDLSGKLILSMPTEILSTGFHSSRLTISSLDKGFYILKISNCNTTTYKYIIRSDK